jgi:hypothetical protein
MPDQTPHPSLRALIQHLRDDPEALRLLALLLTHVAPELLPHIPPEPAP